MADSIVFVYFKNGRIRALDSDTNKSEHEEMLSAGWRHTATVNAAVFIEQLFNEIPDEELKKTIKSLSIK